MNVLADLALPRLTMVDPQRRAGQRVPVVTWSCPARAILKAASCSFSPAM
jgi:hypothetical protein